MAAKTHYVNNKDLLAEVHKSKSSYCSFKDPSYHQYDLILQNISDLNIISIIQAKQTRASRLTAEKFAAAKELDNTVKLADFEVGVEDIPTQDLIFRVISFDHIPLASRKKVPKTIAEQHERVNFTPFKHYKYNEFNTLECVGISHWKGTLEDGEFCKTHGQLTDHLARMIIKICERYLTRRHLNGYTYVDEMQNHAILQLTQMCLQFDESKSSNCFAYLTASISNSIKRILNVEKRHRLIRDELLESHGMAPSFARTTEGEFEANSIRAELLD